MSDIPSLSLAVFAWLFLVIGLTSLAILILYTKYGREISVRLSIISIVIASLFLAFAIHFFLLNMGI
ncbi:MAG: hypothetical protein JSV62_13430 [Promethearchaeota archaeon]|nr:MAG: hypothetical protein JSV62_13430 [Candidatus Lokiarchaeota archaeon]